MHYKINPLNAEESIFSNIDSLEPDFVPRILPFRENEQKEIALALEPLLFGVPARNLFIYGKSGIGKTHAVLRVVEDFVEQNVKAFVINCWINSSSESVIREIARQLNIHVEPDINKIKARITGPCIFVFDEIDRANDFGFLYTFAEEIKNKSIIMISNKKDFFATLDERIRSRLMPEQIEFRPYSEKEIAAILAERRKYAFYEGTWHKDAIALLERKTIEKGDLRFGIALMKHAGLKADREGSAVVFERHVSMTLQRLD
ncbi:MAG: AAA family ATPase [Candidatus Diapherotrites archaeon]